MLSGGFTRLSLIRTGSSQLGDMSKDSRSIGPFTRLSLIRTPTSLAGDYSRSNAVVVSVAASYRFKANNSAAPQSIRTLGPFTRLNVVTPTSLAGDYTKNTTFFGSAVGNYVFKSSNVASPFIPAPVVPGSSLGGGGGGGGKRIEDPDFLVRLEKKVKKGKSLAQALAEEDETVELVAGRRTIDPDFDDDEILEIIDRLF